MGDARAPLEELRRQTQLRTELRLANAPEAVAQLRDAISRGSVKLKADIKKSSAFVKKLKLLTEHGADALVKDAQEINLTRYVSECVAALVEAPLKMADLPAAVRVASLLHQRYADFATLLETTLLAAFDTSYGTDDKHKLVKRRILLRLLTDLFLAGVFSDVQPIATIVQRVARREGGPNQSKSRGGKGNTSMAAASSAGQLEVPLLVSFAKSVGVEFLGVLPKKYKELQTAFPEEFHDVMASQLALVPAAVQAHCLECFQEAFDLICKLYVSQHATLVKLQKRNDREEMNRGDVTEPHVQELDNAKQFFEKLQTSVNALADALDKDVPPLPEERLDDELLGGISLWEGGEGRSEMRADSPFDDEDTRSFYEDLPDLLELVPAVVLGLSEADRAELKKKKEAAQTAAQVESPEEDAEEDDAVVAAAAAGEGDTEEDPSADASDGDAVRDDLDKDERASPSGGDASTASSAAGYHHQHDAFFASLEDMVNRDRCDKAAIDFCYRNSKANRHRLVKTLFNVPRTHLELLSYYARLIATLQSVLKDDIGTELVDLLFDEFNYHLKKRNQFRLESKIKNIRFIAELVKFRVCHPSFAFRCLKRCFADFQGHNVYVATTLLENCGRFLYYGKPTHARMAHFLQIMMKLKSAKHLDAQAETLVENAYYMCRPPERVERAQKQYDPIYLFILKLLYEELNEKNGSKIVKTLRKMPWGNGSVSGMVVKAALKVTNGRVMHMKPVCDVVRGLSRYHEELPILLVDETLEAIRYGLELNDYRDHQVNLGFVKLLGELYNAGLVNVSVVLDVLYLIINHSHDLLQYKGGDATVTPAPSDEFKHRCKLVPDLRFDPRVPSELDGPTNVFRIRLVCALIEACNSTTSSSGATVTTTSTPSATPSGSGGADRGISKSRLGRFLTFFQRYIFTKTEIPLETDFVVLDLLDALATSLKDHLQRFETWEDADEAVAKILREDLEIAERKWAKQQAQAAANAAASSSSTATAVIPEEDESGDDDDDSEEDEDEEEDDEDEEDEEEEEMVGAKRQVDGDDDEEDDDDDSEDDDDDDSDDDEEEDEEEDDEEEQLVVHDRVHKTEEDDEFEKAFKAMMQGSADVRKPAGRVNVDKMAIPTVIKSATPAPTPAFATAGGGAEGDDLRGEGSAFGASNVAATPFGGGVVFRMLRRGNKGKVEARHLVVPEGTSLAQHSQRQENAGKKEQSELKRLVLQNMEREELLAATDLSPADELLLPSASSAAWPALAPSASASSGPSGRPMAQRSGPQGRAGQRPQLTQQQLQQQKQEREAQRAGYGANADWNNDEFGLRRGRGYRGK